MRAAALFLLVMLPPAPAEAVITPERRMPQVRHYDEAAHELGLREWPPYFDNRAGYHVFVRVEAQEAGITMWLPAGAIAQKDLTREANRLQREMALPNARLYTGSYAWGVSLRIQQQVAGFAPAGTRSYTFDLAALRRWSRPLGLEPSWIALRTERGRMLAVTPKPTARGPSGSQDCVFYTKGTLPQGVVRVEHGLSGRWLAAMGSWGVLWIAFPLLTLLAARRHITGLRKLEPVGRLKLFRTWQAVTIAGAVGTAVLTSVWLFSPAASYLFGRISFLLLALSWLGISGLVSLQGRLIGLGLERAAEPEKPLRPWYRVAMGELLSTVGGVLFLAGLIWLFTAGRSTWAWSVAGPVLLGLCLLAAACVLIGVLVNWILTQRRFFVNLAPAAAELTAEIEARCGALGVPPPEVKLSDARGFTLKKGRLLVPRAFDGNLTETQIASLAGAEAFFEHQRQADRTGRWVVFGFIAAFLALAAHSALAMLVGGRPFILAWVLLPFGLPLAVIPISRRWSRMREDADLAVAAMFRNSREYLIAVQKLEELQTAHLDPAARDQASLRERSARLQRRLGLD